jgi:hypothetical protein
MTSQSTTDPIWARSPLKQVTVAAQLPSLNTNGRPTAAIASAEETRYTSGSCPPV